MEFFLELIVFVWSYCRAVPVHPTLMPCFQVTLKDEVKGLQRQAEVVRFRNKMNIVARSGLPLPSLSSGPQAGNCSLTAVVAAANMAKRSTRKMLASAIGCTLLVNTSLFAFL